MSKFKGDLDELKANLHKDGIEGTWSNFDNGHKFKTVDGAILNFYNTGTLQAQGRGNSKDKIDRLVKRLNGVTEPDAVVEVVKAVAAPQLFIVYGHDETSRDQLELILSKLGIESFILAKSSGSGLTIIEALEQHVGRAGTAKAGIVLLTPDDMAYSAREGAEALKGRARQNVILEMGMLLAKLGRQSTLILVKGKLERPSDTDGIIYHSFTNHVKEIVAPLVERLESLGFKIDHKKALEASR
ncbi:TIR domain-containing protein [Pedobacter endophyticus]|uniref:Nucleotide-binding protein n=1 Tax=Pedobacter endophyticus TaxID=2789740 RepID=A0A7U3Q3K7_9SPHI|nr:TIR domain-containing protein [Pedobacter endophyticus]QPH37888.1 nucleotide-binding protein [Pedobacter endophyticus]